MKVITFAIQKGGTGKTSMSVSTAVELAKLGRTLIIDADPQGNATNWLGIEQVQKELSDILSNPEATADDVDSAIQKTQTENLSIIPTASQSSGLGNFQKYGATDDPYSVKRFLREIKDEFDFCVIDTSPAFLGLETACFLASDEIVSVLKIDTFSFEGMQTFYGSLNRMARRYDIELPVIKKMLKKWILNGGDKRLSLQRDYEKYYEQLARNSNALSYTVPVDQAFPKAQAMKIPVQSLDSTKKETLEALHRLASDLAEKSEKDGE